MGALAKVADCRVRVSQQQHQVYMDELDSAEARLREARHQHATLCAQVTHLGVYVDYESSHDQRIPSQVVGPPSNQPHLRESPLSWDHDLSEDSESDYEEEEEYFEEDYEESEGEDNYIPGVMSRISS